MYRPSRRHLYRTARRTAPQDGNDRSAPTAGGRLGGLGWPRRIELVSVVVASLVGLAGLLYSSARVRDELRVSRDELRAGVEGQITDRYTAAVQGLGSSSLDVRLGGIYALQRIMEDSPRDHPTILNVLTAYVRVHSRKQPGTANPPALEDVVAAFTVIAHRNTRRDLKYARG